MVSIWPLTSDKISIWKAVEIAWLVFALFFIIWYGINVPELQAKAQLFWWLGIFALGVIALDLIVKISGVEFVDVILAEEPLIRLSKKTMLGILVFGAFITMFFMANTGYSVSAPTFQIVQLGPAGDAILSFFAASMEDIVFFSIIPASVAGLAYFVFRNPWISLFLFVVVSPFIFVLYHMLAYGFTDVVASTAVYVFGLEMMIWVLLFRNLAWPHIRHGFNNMSKILFSAMSFETFMFMLLTNIWFWAVVIAVIGIIIWRLRGGGK